MSHPLPHLGSPELVRRSLPIRRVCVVIDICDRCRKARLRQEIVRLRRSLLFAVLNFRNLQALQQPAYLV